MKKLYVITLFVLTCLTCNAQYGPWHNDSVWVNNDPDNRIYVGPLNFMTLDVQNHPYIRLTYNENSGFDNYESTTVSGPNPHHQLITTNGQDPCRCYGIVGTNYVHEQYFPTTDIITKPNGSQVDTIIQLGNTSLNNNTQIEYWFYPQVDESTLLVCFSFAVEDVQHHDAQENPRFYIEVLDGQTNQLIQSGYYPTEATVDNLNPTPNAQWPYSRFLAVPSGENSGQDHSVWSDNLHSFVYYWAFPQATPTTFLYRECPSNQTSGQSSYPVKWFEYKPIAFDLSSYAAQGKSVKLRIRSRSCVYFAHWSYGLFYAKMVAGGGTVVSTDDNPIFHLSVPKGFLENTYEWHYGYDSVDASTRPELLINTTPGITGTVYDVLIDHDVLLSQPDGKLWPYYSCKMRSYTGVPFVFEYWLRRYHIDTDFSYQPEENGDAVQFQNLSTLFYSTPPAGPNAEWDTVYEDSPSLRWYVLQNESFTLFAENESNPSYTFTPASVSDGEATVMLVASDSLNHVRDTVVKSFPMSLTGMPAHERGSVTVTPNPTRGTVRVSADRDIEYIRILNADGKQLNTITVQDKAATLDLGHYDGSLFLLDVRFKDGGNVVKKVVKR